MNTQNLLKKLFNEGNCLTYDWKFNARRKTEKMCEQFMLENPHSFCFVQNKKVPLPLLKHTDFQYFAKHNKTKIKNNQSNHYHIEHQ